MRASRKETTAFVNMALTSNTDECINWPFGLVRGYGIYNAVVDEYKIYRAHIYVCCITHGVKKDPLLQTRHLCGNSRCINPRHLCWGTPKENIKDRTQHQGSLAGEANPNAKVNQKQVQEIRERYTAGESGPALGRAYDLTSTSIYAIVKGQTWDRPTLEQEEDSNGH